MRRDRLKKWFIDEFMRGGVEGMDRKTLPTGTVEALAERFVRELPGVVVEDDYMREMDEMLDMHATYLEAMYQATQAALKEDLRPDGKPKVEHIMTATRAEEMRERVADLRIAIEERFELKCPECGTAPPATLCKMDCNTRKYR